MPQVLAMSFTTENKILVVVQVKVVGCKYGLTTTICEGSNPKKVVHQVFVPENISDHRDGFNMENAFSDRSQNLPVSSA
jgi:hypothetical protein